MPHTQQQEHEASYRHGERVGVRDFGLENPPGDYHKERIRSQHRDKECDRQYGMPSLVIERIHWAPLAMKSPKSVWNRGFIRQICRLTPAVTGREASSASPRSGALRG